MNARLIKETRALLPMFACTLPLIVVPSLIWPSEGFGYFALGVACVVMAGSSFGTEFQHRTISLLLSQPIPRSVIWREKMMILGAGMVMSLAVLVVCLVASPSGNGHQAWVVLALIPLCAFCGTPFWTLEMRQGIGGMAAAVGFPSAVMAVCALVNEQLGVNNEAALMTAILTFLFIYCAVVGWLGYAKFKRLEAVDMPSRELSLPGGLEAILVAPLTRISSRFGGPVATLLKKEFRLQQISFLLAGVFVLIARGRILSGEVPPRGGRRNCGGRSFPLRSDTPIDRRGNFGRGRARVGNSRMASDFAAIRADTVVRKDGGHADNEPGPGPAAAGRHVPGRGSTVQPARRENLPSAGFGDPVLGARPVGVDQCGGLYGLLRQEYVAGNPRRLRHSCRRRRSHLVRHLLGALWRLRPGTMDGPASR